MTQPSTDAPFALGHASAGDWRDACEAALAALELRTADANLGFLYVTDRFAGRLADIHRFFAERTGIGSWIGTVGAGVLATGREYFGEPAVAAMAGAFPPDSFRVFRAGADGGDLAGAERAWLEAAEPRFGVVHADSRHPELMELIPRIVADHNSFLVGGLSSSSAAQVHVADGVNAGGLSGALFGAGVPVVAGLSQGCSPIGPVREITACEGNVAIEIDGAPALEALREDMGELLARDLARAVRALHVAFPVAGSDRADYVVRNFVGLDPDAGLLAVAAPLAKGQSILFCRRDGQAARDDLVRMLRDLKGRAGGAPRGALYYSCVARGPNLFGPDSAELATVADELGPVPLVGFFCNGEISHDRLYGYTGVLTLFM